GDRPALRLPATRFGPRAPLARPGSPGAAALRRGDGLMRFPAALRALNHRDFRLFWLGQSLSVIGSWMQSVGLSLLVLELTDSPIRLGLVSALQFAPLLAFSLIAGVIVDRVPKRRLVLT